MSHPWLSAIIPTYNGGAFLAEALDSIVRQQSDGFECIAIDDGSDDATMEILQAYTAKLPLRIISGERTGNWVMNTNRALREARGAFACFLHQDDLWDTDRLQAIQSVLKEKNGQKFIYHATRFVDVSGKGLGLWKCPLPGYPAAVHPDMLIERLLVQNFICISAPVFHRETALASGGLDESLWYTADWDLWLRMASEGDSVYIPNVLSSVRVHPDSQTMTRSRISNEFRDQLSRVLNRYFEKWKAPEKKKQDILSFARFSVDVNVYLAAVMHGDPVNHWVLFKSFLSLGPAGWNRYLTYSRIWERASARIKSGRLSAQAPQDSISPQQ